MCIELRSGNSGLIEHLGRPMFLSVNFQLGIIDARCFYLVT